MKPANKQKIDIKRVARVYACIKCIIDNYAKSDEQTREYIDATLDEIVRKFDDE